MFFAGFIEVVVGERERCFSSPWWIDFMFAGALARLSTQQLDKVFTSR